MLHRSILRLAGLAAISLSGILLLGSRFPGTSPPGNVQFAALPAATAAQRVATFAGGCFWSMQKAFDGVPGIVSVTAGYAGGSKASPSYQEVETGRTGHAESVQVVFDPARTSYAKLLDVYWHSIDPTSTNGQSRRCCCVPPW